MKSQSQKNSEEIIKLQGEVKVIHEKIINIRDNHLAHLDSKVNTIYKLLWVAVTISLSGLINLVVKSSVLKGKKSSIKGTVGEYDAIAKLTKAGYYVAKSCDPSCPFDIVIVDKNGKIQLLDI